MAILAATIIGASIAIRFNKKIEETIAPAAICMMLIMFLSGRWIGLKPGFVICIAVSALCFVYCVYKLITDRNDVFGALFTWGGLAFIIYLFFFAYYSYHRDFSHPDELYYWGLMAREYYTYQTMNSPMATSLASGAVPLMPLWNCLSSMMWFGFSDSICYFSQNMFTLSLMLPMYAHIRKRDFGIVDFAVLTIMIPILLVVSGMDGFRYIICDMLLAAELCFFMMSALAYLRDSNLSDFLSMIAVVIAMCLTKRAGVLFAAIAIFIITGAFLEDSLIRIRDLVILVLAPTLITFIWFGSDKYVLIPAVMFIGALFFYFAFTWAATVNNSVSPFVMGLLVGVIGVGVAGYVYVFLLEDGYSYDVMARFLNDFFSISIGSEDSTGYIYLSYGYFALLALVFAMLLREQPSLSGINDDTGVYKSVFLNTVIGMMAYALAMLYVHINGTGLFNKHRESLIPRYIIPWEILVVFLVIFVIVIRNDRTSTLMILIALVAVLVISDSGTFFRGLFSKHRCIGYYAFQDAGITPEYGDLIYFIDEQPYFYYSDREFYNYVAPAKTNFIDQIFLGNNGRIEMTAEELSKDITCDRYLHVPYDYLYLQSYDEDFIERYGDLFENVADIESGRVYEVQVCDTGLVLKLLGD